MEIYENLSRKSGVVEYEIGRNYVMVIFERGNIISYDTDEFSEEVISQIKELAKAGEGLNRFLNQL
jgi:hypothetical protein